MREDRYIEYQEWEESAKTQLEVGSIWVKYPELPHNHPNRMTLEIRGFVDYQVVYRYWMQNKGYFGYGMRGLMEIGRDLDPEHRGGTSLHKSEVQDWLALGVPQEYL